MVAKMFILFLLHVCGQHYMWSWVMVTRELNLYAWIHILLPYMFYMVWHQEM